MNFMRASNRSYWQHNDNVGFHLKNAATLSNQWGPLQTTGVQVLRPFQDFYATSAKRCPIFLACLHPIGWNSPYFFLEIYFRPFSQNYLARASGRQDEELES